MRIEDSRSAGLSNTGSQREEELRTTETQEEKVPAKIQDTELSPKKESTEEQFSSKRRTRKDRSF